MRVPVARESAARRATRGAETRVVTFAEDSGSSRHVLSLHRHQKRKSDVSKLCFWCLKETIDHVNHD